jgi:spermidine synthase
VNRNFINRIKLSNNSIYLIAVGFFSILGQVVILRELNVAFYGIELIYILSFAFWLIGTAIGATIGHRAYIPDEVKIHKVILGSAFLLIVDIVFIRGIRHLFGGVQGGYLPFLIQIIGLIIALLPIGLIAGLLFQWTAKRFVGFNKTLAKAYAIESAGGVLGGLSSTLFLNLGVNNFSTAIICGLCFVIIVIYYSIKSVNRFMNYVAITMALGFLILVGLSHSIDLLMTSWNHPYLIESIDTPYNRVTITSPENQICVFEDDALSYETQSIEDEEFIQLSSLQTTNLNSVLILGGGFTGIIPELLKLPVKKIDYVEINKNLIEVLQKKIPSELSNFLRDEKVNIIYNDPRKFLQQKHSYNFILIGMPEPMSARTNRFYTQEFFKQCVNSLTEKGILSFKIQSSENIWIRQLIERNAGIYNALKSVFSNVVVLPGPTNIFIASKSELVTDVKFLIDRFNERKPQTKLVSARYINYIFTNDRFFEIKKLLKSSSQVINSDVRPVCYGYTISIWLSKFFPGLAFSEMLSPDIFKLPNSLPIYLILLSIMILLSRKFVGFRRFILVFLAGFIGMIMEIILILLYQSKNGVLFRDIGLLLMAFMAGLTLGSYGVNKIFIMLKNRMRYQFWLGCLLLIGFSLLNFIIYYFVKAELMDSLLIIFIAILFDGIFVSGIFAFTSLYKIENQQIVIKQLYTADLIGGSLGSLIASLLLIPVYGFFLTLILLLILSLYCIIFII